MSQELYCVMCRQIFEIVPELRTNVTSEMMDYERAAMNSILLVYKGAFVAVYAFHYFQVIQKRNLIINQKVNMYYRVIQYSPSSFPWLLQDT